MIRKLFYHIGVYFLHLAISRGEVYADEACVYEAVFLSIRDRYAKCRQTQDIEGMLQVHAELLAIIGQLQTGVSRGTQLVTNIQHLLDNIAITIACWETYGKDEVAV